MSRPVKVLMVEDSENDAELLLLELRRQGLTPKATRVDTGADLQTALTQHDWDVVISDHNMPGFSGEEALKLVKTYKPDVPFIVVSGTRGEEHAVEAMRAGASDFVVKSRLHRLAPVVERELYESELRLEQRRMAAALAESQQQQLRQAQKLEAVGRLAGGVAHDFNNLMAAILSHADLVLKGLAGQDPHRADLEEIKEAGARAAELTRQLLAFSRQQVLERTVLNLNHVIDDVLRLLRKLVGEGITVETECQSHLWNIQGDRVRIEQILMNLAVNARDAMPDGGTLSIATANTVVTAPGMVRMPPLPGSYVRLEVRDTGQGIPEDILPKIFEPFFTTKEVGKGTGLGLATVYGIVQQSGGSIFVHSEPGRGTQFTIYLPQTTEAGEARAPGFITHATSEGDERILLVESDHVVRERSLRLLSNAGYRVSAADGALQALELVAGDATPLHLLVTDVNIDGMTGPALAAHLRETYPDLRVLFMTDTSAAIDPLEIFESGDILVKPFAAADLVARVREALSQTTA